MSGLDRPSNCSGAITLCIKPVNGWWRDRTGREYVNKQTRYSLIVTLSAQNVDVDLYTPVKAVVDVPAAEIETAIRRQPD